MGSELKSEYVFELDKKFIHIQTFGDGSTGMVATDLRERCPCCGRIDCYFSCDESQEENSPESEDEALQRNLFNAAIDGLTSFLLTLACDGYDMSQFKKHVAITIEHYSNQFS